MRIHSSTQYVLKFVTIGLALAFLLVVINPSLLQRQPLVAQAPNAALHPPLSQPARMDTHGPFSYANAVKLAAPTVVNIYSTKIDRHARQNSGPLGLPPFFNELVPFDAPVQQESSLGSGLIFSSQGHVLTNNHVIDDATEVEVMLADGRHASAKLVGTDPDTDLAVLKIDLTPLPTIPLGNSDQIEVGDVVLAIGNPYGVGQTVTMGIVSATGRKRLGLNTFENFIQTDAAINPGNSGGALINPRGQLVGVNSAIFSRSGGSQGIGFAIPVNQAANVLSQIVEHGHVIRGWLGIRMNNLNPRLAEAFGLPSTDGVVVTAVFKQSPALKAGLRPGDVLIKVNDQAIRDVRTILDLIAQERPGNRIRIEGIRETKPFSIKTEVGQRPFVDSNPDAAP